MNPSDLESSWAPLSRPRASGDLVGVRVPQMPGKPAIVWLAKDDTDRRHLLVEVSPETPPLNQRGTRGLEVTTRTLRIGDRAPATFVDLACVDPAHQSTFAAVACDIANAIAASPADPRTGVLRALERWRSFWSVDPSGLTREEVLGLFGELWFMTRWMGPVSRTVVERWQGPSGARHDFQWRDASVEVKTGLASGDGLVHKIASIDQLADPETGALYLFSLHVADDALAANTLPILVERVFSETGKDEDASRLFGDKLALAGYNPAHADRYGRKLRITAEQLYHVEGSFPRLTLSSFNSGLPAGVHGISYFLSISACGPWRIATNPSDPVAAFLRRSA